MKSPQHLHRAGLAVVFVALLLFACRASGDDTRSQASTPAPADMGLVQDVAKLVRQHYVEPVQNNQLLDNALKGMLTGLDPHSDYLDENAYRDLRNDTRGEFGGVGIQLTLEKGLPKVISPIDGTPAAHAGIDPGDAIVKIDGRSTVGMSLQDIVRLVRGVPGTTVRLGILRANDKPFDVTLTRSIIHVASVKSHLEKNRIGYIRITMFSQTTPEEFTGAITDLRKQAKGGLNGLVLDLRNDPGGLLDAAVDVSGSMLDGGPVVTIRGRDRNDEHVYKASSRGDVLRNVPIVVLINGASASAAEIVAGALQDHHRATVMGNRSFGKGSVQTIIPIEGHGALRLTTARYYTPSGRSIQDLGIDPDIVVGLPKDAQVPNMGFLREADLPHALRNTGSLSSGPARNPKAGTVQPAADADAAPIDPKFIGTDKDHQLGAALDYLQGVVLKNAASSGG